MKCLYANVDQLPNKMEDLKSVIAEDNPDIMLFTEVIPKAQKNAILEAQLSIAGYQIYTNFKFTDLNLGASGKRGVAIFVKNDLKNEKVTLQSDYEDQLWVEIQLKKNESLLCGCIYRSPNKDNVVNTTTDVCKIINEATGQNNSHLMICGDTRR